MQQYKIYKHKLFNWPHTFLVWHKMHQLTCVFNKQLAYELKLKKTHTHSAIIEYFYSTKFSTITNHHPQQQQKTAQLHQFYYKKYLFIYIYSFQQINYYFYHFWNFFIHIFFVLLNNNNIKMHQYFKNIYSPNHNNKR